MGYRPRMPDRFGGVPAGYGLMFTCACSRGMALPRADLLRRWGEEGRIAEVAQRFRCRNCLKRGATVRIVKIGDQRSASERRRDAMEPIDKLVCEIEALKPGGKVS